jgi:secreted PhoX family phosphatase
MLVTDLGTSHTQRFLTGLDGYEVTGIWIIPDARSLFVDTQHPGQPISFRMPRVVDRAQAPSPSPARWQTDHSLK